MKKDLHPQYYDKAEVICACGAHFTVGSTVQSMKVEICSQCHPFYTGQNKIIDTAGRVQKFEARMKKTEVLKAKAPSKKTRLSKQKAKITKESKTK
ncbi:MAG: 50S ribosomal protein L31 [Minisyncoccia bacterium]